MCSVKYNFYKRDSQYDKINITWLAIEYRKMSHPQKKYCTSQNIPEHHRTHKLKSKYKPIIHVFMNKH